MSDPRNRVLTFMFLIVLPLLGSASAANVYITPDGTSQGRCTINPHTPQWFNNSSNWGSGAGQIGPGTTVLICGSFLSSTPGATLLTIQGSGISGNPITLLFDTNASLTNSTYWGYGSSDGGAIFGSSKSYITINGGTTGLIQNTGNGTGLAYEMPSSGVSFLGGS